MEICEFGIITRFLHEKKSGLDNFMVISKLGDESGGNITWSYCTQLSLLGGKIPGETSYPEFF